jgi:hypothetical protein
MPLIMFVSSSFNTYVNLPKKIREGERRRILAQGYEKLSHGLGVLE